MTIKALIEAGKKLDFVDVCGLLVMAMIAACLVAIAHGIYTQAERDPPKQTAHYIVDPETNHGEWECR